METSGRLEELSEHNGEKHNKTGSKISTKIKKEKCYVMHFQWLPKISSERMTPDTENSTSRSWNSKENLEKKDHLWVYSTELKCHQQLEKVHNTTSQKDSELIDKKHRE